MELLLVGDEGFHMRWIVHIYQMNVVTLQEGNIRIPEERL